jgi:tetratricopeptide (TPR) repeat protein
MSRKSDFLTFSLIAAASFLPCSSQVLAQIPLDQRATAATLVLQIQKADYQANRADLHRLSKELAPLADNKDLTARVQYWRGFALWRSAINGFNDNADKQEIQQDLNQAIDAFEKSLASDPAFVDSKIAIASCLGFLAYSFERGSPQQQEHIARIRQTLKEAQDAAPDNPRLLWVLGPVYWNIPAERGGGQDKAIATYEKALEITRTHKKASSDALDPSWGEPELLMSLAWSNLNRATPDLKAAEQNAQAALALVPDWHYVRDILMKQIQDAKAKRNGTS